MNYVVTPESDIELFCLPIELDQKNQLTFKNINEQNNYFNGLEKFLVDNSTFQRNDYTVRLPLTFDETVKYNYCRYKNNNKWYYAFITNPTYINTNMTTITLITDVWQTYMFDIKLGVSFVERETTNNDEFGQNTYPEELELGDMVCTDEHILGGIDFNYLWENINNKYYICMETTIDPNELWDVGKGISGGIPQSYTQYLYKCNSSGLQQLGTDIQKIIDVGGTNRENAIINVYLVHPLAIPTDHNYENGDFVASTTPAVRNFDLGKIDTLLTYKPVNKKLLTYPYCYFELTNGLNGMSIYKPELCNLYSENHGKLTGNVYGLINPGNSIKFIPVNYDGNNNAETTTYTGSYSNSLNLGKLPLLSWASDPYTAWLVNNTLNQSFRELRQDIKTGTSIASSILGSGTGNVSSVRENGGITNFYNPLSITANAVNVLTNMTRNLSEGEMIEQENLRERYLHSLEPDTVRGSTDGADISVAISGINFRCRKMTIKPEIAKKIDGYFYKYGYKICETKIIDIYSRQKFNYIKTVGVIIKGCIPQIYLNALKSMFNNGITFWHNPDTFMEYSSDYNDNPIVY